MCLYTVKYLKTKQTNSSKQNQDMTSLRTSENTSRHSILRHTTHNAVVVIKNRVRFEDSSESDREPSPSSSVSWASHRNSPPPVDYECAECFETFETAAAICEHMEISKECGSKMSKRVRCDFCSKSFKHNCQLKRHKCKGQVDRPLYTCNECGKEYSRKDRLSYHLRMQHSKKSSQNCQKYKCEKKKCGYKFTRRTDLNRHRRAVHLKMREYKCNDCGQNFAQKSNMLNHQKVVHAKVVTSKVETDQSVEVAAFPCPNCNKRFTRRHNMTTHIQTVHDGQKPFKCTSCTLSFGLKVILKKHVKALHSESTNDQSLFLCTICNKKFTQKSNLSTHIQLHDKNRKLFTYTVCQQGYTRKAALDKHPCPGKFEIMKNVSI